MVPAAPASTDTLLPLLAALIQQALALPPDRLPAERDTPLLGAVPELDSMAVVSLLTALEDRFGITLDESELSAETFSTLGSLGDFVSAQLAR